MPDDLKAAALDYHRYPTPGKLAVIASKPLANQRDLALAYSPGVAAACEEIARDPGEAATLTARANLVAVVTNGTAVLGLGSIGPLASKPVMEGKAVLFKQFAGINVFDLEVDALDPDTLVEVVAALEPTFGGINLEDIKAPECFEVERRLRERMSIPVFHDDQHGTAICVAAAVRNALRIAEKDIGDVRLVCSGAGAAALACLDLLVCLGLERERIVVNDIIGVVYEGRAEQMDPYKSRYAVTTDARTLDDVIGDADIFLGLSAPGVLEPEQVARMADNPIILALANPDPEILPELVHETRADAIMATGRSDYPNQVNNVLCFPFLFRGALDVGASEINEAMKVACVEAISDLATAEVSDIVASKYGGAALRFGREYLLPKPFDPRLMLEVPPVVARAAMDSGVATRPIEDFDAYRRKLKQFVFRSGLVMKPIFERARRKPQRIAYAEGESDRVLNATKVVVDEGICRPLLIGRHSVIEANIRRLGLSLSIGEQVDVLDPADNPHFERDWHVYHDIMGRRGFTPDYAKSVVRTRATALGALLVHHGEADALICGVEIAYQRHLEYLINVIGLRDGVRACAGLNLLILNKGTFFLTDTHVSDNPSPEDIAAATMMAADVVRQFGMKPKAALLSHSNFGSSKLESAEKMRRAVELLTQTAPDLAVDGEMQADAAVSAAIRDHILPGSTLTGSANLLVMPSLDAANIAYNLLKILGDGVNVGPILMGMRKPVHILSNSVTVRGIANMSAVAALQAAESGGTADAGLATANTRRMLSQRPG